MSARRWSVLSKGRTPEEAFENAKRQALHDFGHREHSGTIAMKKDFVMIDPPKKGDPLWRVEEILDNFDKRIRNVYGPAGCMVHETHPESLTEIIALPVEKATTIKGDVEDIKDLKWETWYTLWVNGKRFGKYKKKTDATKTAKTSAIHLQQEVEVRIEQLPSKTGGIVAAFKPVVRKTKVKHEVPISTYIFFGFSNCNGVGYPNVREENLQYLLESEEAKELA